MKAVKERTGSLPLHSEIAVELTWDMAALYRDLKDWEADYDRIGGLCEAVRAFRGRMGESPAVLAAAFKASDALERLLEKIYTYAHLLSDEDTSLSANRAMVDRVSARYADISGELSWFHPEVLSIPEEKLRSWLTEPETAFYRRTI